MDKTRSQWTKSAKTRMLPMFIGGVRANHAVYGEDGLVGCV